MSESDTPAVVVHRIDNQGGTGVAVHVGNNGRARARSNLPLWGNRPWVGRNDELAWLRETVVERELPAVLHGAPGVGKSALVERFGHQAAHHFPGGVFVVRGDSGAPLYVDVLHLAVAHVGLAQPSAWTADDLSGAYAELQRTGRVLLLVDNAPSPSALGVGAAWLPGETSRVAVVITSTHEAWPAVFRSRALEALAEDDVASLVQALDPGGRLRGDEPGILARASGGVLATLCPAVEAVIEARRRGRKKVDVEVVARELHRYGTESYGRAWRLLERDDRRLLSVAAFLAPGGFTPEVVCGMLGWSADHPSLDVLQDRRLLTGDADRMCLHGLLRRWVQEHHPPVDSDAEGLAMHILDVARAIVRNPTNSVALAALRSIQPSVLEVGRFLIAPEPVQIAALLDSACSSAGLFNHALGWCRAALAGSVGAALDIEDSDLYSLVDGAPLEPIDVSVRIYDYASALSVFGETGDARRWAQMSASRLDRAPAVDPEVLSQAMHLVGTCLSTLGEHLEAQGWYERAVRESERGDPIDRKGLARSMYELGGCLYDQGRYPLARSWFERAIEPAELGGDRDVLVRCRYMIGVCFEHEGSIGEAQIWLERAAADGADGDASGRVDHTFFGALYLALGSCLLQQEWTVCWSRTIVIARIGPS